MEFVTKEDLIIINAALERGDTVKIRHSEKSGTKITRESSHLLKTKPIGSNKK